MTTNNAADIQGAISFPVATTQGGTGLATLTTAYGVVCAGTTATGNLQNAGAGTSGQLLTSNGPSALPSFQTYTAPPGPGVKNFVIGGDMDLNPWQSALVPLTSANGHTADMWRATSTGPGAMTVSRATDAPSVALVGQQLTKCYKAAVTTADGTMASTSQYGHDVLIEGYNYAQFAQQAITIGFAIKSTVTGTSCVSLRNGANTQSVVKEFTITASNTWQYASITIPALSTTGSWDYTTGTGIKLHFSMGAGSNFQTTAGSWATGNFTATSNQVNHMSSTSNIFEVAKVSINLGSTLAPFEFRTPQQELFLCQRYFFKTFPQDQQPSDGQGTASAITYNVSNAGVNYHSVQIIYPAIMRANPTLVFYNPGGGTTGKWRNGSGADSGVADTNYGRWGGTSLTSEPWGVSIYNPQVAGDAVNSTCFVQFTADARLT